MSFFNDVFQGFTLESQICEHSLEALFLFFKLLKALDIRDLYVPVLGLPVVVGCVKDTLFSADIDHRPATLNLLQHLDYLWICKSRFTYCHCKRPANPSCRPGV